MKEMRLPIHWAIALGLSALLTNSSAALPTVTGGLIAAFDGSDITTAGEFVTSWNDLSGNSNDFTQVTGAAQPTLASSVTPGGTNAIQFDGTGNFLDIAANPGDFDGNQFSWYIVYAGNMNNRRMLLNAYTDIDDVLGGDQYSGQLWGNIAGNNGRNRALVRDVSNSFHAANTPDDAMDTGTFYVTGGSWDGANSSSDNLTSILVTGLGDRLVGTAEAYNIDGNAVPSGHLRTRLGADINYSNPTAIDSPSAFFSGQIAEVLLYDRMLNPSEQASVEDYLFSKHIGSAPSSYTWNTDSSGKWLSASNWTDANFGPPNDNNTIAVLGDSIGSATKTVYTDEAVTVNGIAMSNSFGGSYVVAGSPALTLATSDSLVKPTITVAQGNHQLQIAINLTDDTGVTVTSGTLDFNNEIDLNGNTLALSGNVNINHSTVDGGSVASLSGTLGTAGSTSIAGDLTASDTLLFDLGESNADSFNVGGVATLSGTLDIELESGFTPVGTYTLVTAGTSLDAAGLSLDPSDTSMFTLTTQGNSLLLTVISGLAGDYNGDGIVNAADYTVWRDSFGQTGSGLAADGDNSGEIDAGDFAVWTSNFGNSSAVSAAVPEPASACLLLLASVAGLGTCRQSSRH